MPLIVPGATLAARQGASVDTANAVVEIQATGRAAGEPGPGSELVAAAQRGLRGREVSQDPAVVFFGVFHVRGGGRGRILWFLVIATPVCVDEQGRGAYISPPTHTTHSCRCIAGFFFVSVDSCAVNPPFAVRLCMSALSRGSWPVTLHCLWRGFARLSMTSRMIGSWRQ